MFLHLILDRFTGRRSMQSVLLFAGSLSNELDDFESKKPRSTWRSY